jgi:hypothetical protein
MNPTLELKPIGTPCSVYSNNSRHTAVKSLAPSPKYPSFAPRSLSAPVFAGVERFFDLSTDGALTLRRALTPSFARRDRDREADRDGVASRRPRGPRDRDRDRERAALMSTRTSPALRCETVEE